jgi:hypothetical protein
MRAEQISASNGADNYYLQESGRPLMGFGPGRTGCVHFFTAYAGMMIDTSTTLVRRLRWWWPVLLAVLLAGCATHPKIDWASRVGNYTFDQAVMEFGPPDKQARLTDHSLVAEWLTQRGYVYSYPAYGFGYGYPWYWGPYYPAYNQVYVPGYYLRLVFDADNKLKSWQKFSR